MAKEIISENQLLTALIAAAKKGNWDQIDIDLVPQLNKVNGDLMAKELLSYTDNTNPDIRDLVATCLTLLIITNKDIKNKSIVAMIKMATTDAEVFPAGRAAVFLIKYSTDDQYKDMINQAMTTFNNRVHERGWLSDIEENIPELKDGQINKFVDGLLNN